MLGTRPFRRFRQQGAGVGSPSAEAQGLDPEAVRLKALQDQLAAWAYDIDQHRAMQRAVLAKMHGLGSQQAAAYGTPFPGSSTTTNHTTTNAGVSVGGITGILGAMLGAALLGALLTQPVLVAQPAAGPVPPPTPAPRPVSPSAGDGEDGWRLIVVPAPGEIHEP